MANVPHACAGFFHAPAGFMVVRKAHDAWLSVQPPRASSRIIIAIRLEDLGLHLAQSPRPAQPCLQDVAAKKPLNSSAVRSGISSGKK